MKQMKKRLIVLCAVMALTASTVSGNGTWSIGEDSARTGCGHCRQRYRTDWRRSNDSRNGHAYRAEDWRKYTYGTGCHVSSCGGNW